MNWGRSYNRAIAFVLVTAFYAAANLVGTIATARPQEAKPAPDRYRVSAGGRGTLREKDGESVLELTDGVTIVHGDVTITSRTAIHYTDRRFTYLRGDVVIVQGNLRMYGEEGEYDSAKDLSRLTGRVRIVDADWDVVCDEARYNRATGDAWLIGNVVARDSVSTLYADRLRFNRNTGEAEAFGHVQITNPEEGFVVRGRHGFYNRDTHEGVIDQEPVLIVDPETKEPVTVVSDTMRVYPDSGLAIAYYRVKIIKGSTVTQSDSAAIYDDDKRAELYGSPLAKQQHSSMSGGRMTLFYNDDEVHRIEIEDGAELREQQQDSFVVGRNNWMEGESMSLHIHDSRVDSIQVVGSARSEYFPPTRGRVESNHIEGDSMFFRFDHDSLTYVRVQGNAEGVYRYYDPIDGETTDSLRAVADSALSYVNFEEKMQVVKYSARSIEYFADERDLLLDGAARLVYGTNILTGQEITYYSQINLLDARGNPQLVEGAQKFHGDRMNYDLERKTGLVTKGSTRFEEGFYTGEHVAKVGENEMKVWNSIYTTCDLAKPHFHFSAKEMKVYTGDKVVSGPMWLYVGDTPLFYLPFMASSIQRGRRSGILRLDIDFGVTGGGRFIRNVGYYWAMSDYTDVRFQTDFNEDNDFAINTRGNYVKRYSYRGTVDYRFYRSLRTYRNSWTVEGRHNQDPINGYRFNASGRFASSDNAVKNVNRIDQVERYIDRSLRSNASLSKNWRRTGFSASVSRDQKLFTEDPITPRVTAVLPNITLTIPAMDLYFGQSSRKGKEGLLEKILSNAKLSPRLSGRRDTQYQRAAVSGIRVKRNVGGTLVETDDDMVYNERIVIRQSLGLQSPQRFGIIGINPSISASNTTVRVQADTSAHYVDTSDTTTVFVPYGTSTTTEQDFSWRTGVSANTKIYGTFYPRIGGLRALRHTLTPSASYSYTPPINGRVRRQSLSLSLQNAFDIKVVQGRDANVGAQNRSASPALVDSTSTEEKLRKISGVMIWNLRASLNPDAPSGSNWSNISSTLNTSALPFRISMSNTIDPYEREIINTTLTSGLSIGGTHPFGHSTEVTVRELNVVAASDTSAQLDPQRASGYQGSAAASFEISSDGETVAPEPDELAIEEGRLPWSANLDLSFSKAKAREPRSTLRFSTKLSLTPSWEIFYSAQYDVIDRDLRGHNIRISRDLHCWEMSLTRTQLGDEWQFYFTIRLKAIPDLYAEQGRRGLRGGGGFASGFIR